MLVAGASIGYLLRRRGPVRHRLSAQVGSLYDIAGLHGGDVQGQVNILFYQKNADPSAVDIPYDLSQVLDDQAGQP